jgi:tRNA-2-methylthio-N6-dimethylallyladenosine synthase
VAAGLVDDVPAAEKQRRLAHVIELQRRITEERSSAWVGREVEVLVDGLGRRGEGTLVGKTRESRNAVFEGPPSWIGGVRRMRVTATRGVTLTGEAVSGEVEATCGS